MFNHFRLFLLNHAIIQLCLFALLFVPLNSFADETELDTDSDYGVDCIADDDDDYENPELPKQPFFSFLDSPHKNVSSSIEYISRGIDGFFSNEKFYRETTSSYIHYRIDSISRESGEYSTHGKLRIRLDLPITRKKLKLVFESDPIEQTNPTQLESKQTEDTNNGDYYLGLQAKEKKKRKWRISRSLGIKVRLPLEPYVRVRITRDFPFDDWTLKVNETLYWFKTKGSGFDTYLDFERKVTNSVLFRASSAARWSDENDYFLLSQYLTIFHTLSEKRAVSYYIGAFGQSQPNIYATDYIIGTNYRQRIHHDWLFIEVKPEIHYRKIIGFEPEHKLTLSMEAFFGSKYL